MRKFVSFAAGVAAGTVAMYYLDEQNGRRRRALARDKVVGAGHDAAASTGAAGRRTVNHLKGFLATHRFGRARADEPQTDFQLHERIRARLGRVVSYPKSVQVEVDQGNVHLRGIVLTRELNDLLHELRHMSGVLTVTSDLTCCDTAQGISELRSKQAAVEETETVGHA